MTEAVSAAEYRDVMRHWPSGVAVVTFQDGAGRHGLTVSAFTSLSVTPPMVLVAIDRRGRSRDRLSAAGAFCVGMLAFEQRDIADRFAGRQPEVLDRFAGLATETAVTGAPVLTGVVAYLDCEVVDTHDTGDHTIFVGRVVACAARRPDADPLAYHRREYVTVRRSAEP
jgi:flavin reductase (DIM6/NTAB) family NADH-FMN oxidoreductase RutF